MRKSKKRRVARLLSGLPGKGLVSITLASALVLQGPVAAFAKTNERQEEETLAQSDGTDEKDESKEGIEDRDNPSLLGASDINVDETVTVDGGNVSVGNVNVTGEGNEAVTGIRANDGSAKAASVEVSGAGKAVGVEAHGDATVTVEGKVESNSSNSSNSSNANSTAVNTQNGGKVEAGDVKAEASGDAVGIKADEGGEISASSVNAHSSGYASNATGIEASSTVDGENTDSIKITVDGDVESHKDKDKFENRAVGVDASASASNGDIDIKVGGKVISDGFGVESKASNGGHVSVEVTDDIEAMTGIQSDAEDGGNSEVKAKGSIDARSMGISSYASGQGSVSDVQVAEDVSNTISTYARDNGQSTIKVEGEVSSSISATSTGGAKNEVSVAGSVVSADEGVAVQASATGAETVVDIKGNVTKSGFNSYEAVGADSWDGGSSTVKVAGEVQAAEGLGTAVDASSRGENSKSEINVAGATKGKITAGATNGGNSAVKVEGSAIGNISANADGEKAKTDVEIGKDIEAAAGTVVTASSANKGETKVEVGGDIKSKNATAISADSTGEGSKTEVLAGGDVVSQAEDSVAVQVSADDKGKSYVEVKGNVIASDGAAADLSASKGGEAALTVDGKITSSGGTAIHAETKDGKIKVLVKDDVIKEKGDSTGEAIRVDHIGSGNTNIYIGGNVESEKGDGITLSVRSSDTIDPKDNPNNITVYIDGTINAKYAGIVLESHDSIIVDKEKDLISLKTAQDALYSETEIHVWKIESGTDQVVDYKNPDHEHSSRGSILYDAYKYAKKGNNTAAKYALMRYNDGLKETDPSYLDFVDISQIVDYFEKQENFLENYTARQQQIAAFQESFAKENIKYIIRITQPAVGGTISVNGTEIGQSAMGDSYEYAGEGKDLIIKVAVQDGYELASVSGGSGITASLQEDGTYLLTVPRGGGVDISAVLNAIKAAEPTPEAAKPETDSSGGDSANTSTSDTTDDKAAATTPDAASNGSQEAGTSTTPDTASGSNQETGASTDPNAASGNSQEAGASTTPAASGSTSVTPSPAAGNSQNATPTPAAESSQNVTPVPTAGATPTPVPASSTRSRTTSRGSGSGSSGGGGGGGGGSSSSGSSVGASAVNSTAGTNPLGQSAGQDSTVDAPDTPGSWAQGADGNWNYKGADGANLLGWIVYGKQWYYLGENGIMLKGWQKIADKWYYFETEAGQNQGHMYLSRTTPDGYTVGADGSWQQG